MSNFRAPDARLVEAIDSVGDRRFLMLRLLSLFGRFR
jgi:hypothetical protein